MTRTWAETKTLADFVRHRTGDRDQERIQNLSKENHERNVPAWVRDGRHEGVEDRDSKDKLVTVGPDPKTVIHGLNRMPQGWFTHSHKGDAHSIVEVSKNEKEIVLQNMDAGAGTVTCKLWIW